MVRSLIVDTPSGELAFAWPEARVSRRAEGFEALHE